MDDLRPDALWGEAISGAHVRWILRLSDKIFDKKDCTAAMRFLHRKQPTPSSHLVLRAGGRVPSFTSRSGSGVGNGDDDRRL